MQSHNWLELAQQACAAVGVQASVQEQIANWDQRGCANAVYRLEGARYLKVFGPGANWQYAVERCVLAQVTAETKIPVPAVLHDSALPSGEPFLILGGLPGSTAEQVWDSLPRADQLRLAADLGRLTRALHQLPTEPLAGVEGQHGGWRAHNMRYRDHHVDEIHAAADVPENQRLALVHFVDQQAPAYLQAHPVVTHFDMAHNHFYLDQVKGQPQITGLIDWGEATLGPAEWDLAYLWFWTFSQDRDAMAHCLDAYFESEPRPPDLARRCLAAVFYTSCMALLWPAFVAQASFDDDIVTEFTRSLFPPELFGEPG